jgi:type VI secretion system protein ImpK
MNDLARFPASAAAPRTSGAPATGPAPSGFCLVDRFAEFWDEVVRQKRQITSTTGAEISSPWQVLRGILERQAEAAKKAESAARYSQAQYVMAVFADEVFLGMVWPGRQSWDANPLEMALFGTREGRDAVFDRIEALLGQGAQADPDLAKVYLFALSLGLRGRYRGGEETVHLDTYRKELYRAVYGVEPGNLPGAGRLFPQAYLSTRSRGDVEKLPQVVPWVIGFLVVFAGFLVASHLVWMDATAGLQSVVEKILALP